MEAVPEPRRSKRGLSDPAARNGSRHTLLHPPTTDPERGLSIQRRKRSGPDGGVTPVRVPEAYGSGQPGRLSGQKIRLRGRRQGRPRSESAGDSVSSDPDFETPTRAEQKGGTEALREPPPP